MRKKIEGSFPLREVNRLAMSEKIKKGHPGNIHLWWNRSPMESSATGLEGFVYELGLIKDLLLLPDERIQYDTDISYSIEDQIIENQRNVQRVFSGRESDATAEDYAREIGKYIAKKKERAVEVLYEFEITGLRPQETKWLGPLILVKPTEDGKMAITYTIKSAHSPGIVDGRLMAE